MQKQTVATGETAIISLTLIGVAPADGARVSVVSSEPTALPVEAVYVIPAGQSTTSFGVPAGLVSTAMTVTLTASYGGTSATASVIVTPPQTVPLSAVSVTPAVIPSGQTASMTLTLSAPAPAGGATVGTFSTSTVLLNAAYTIAPGQTSGDFVIQAGTVSAATQVVIYASYGGVTQTATVNVVPSNAPVTLSSYTIAPATAIAGDTVTLTFGLTGPAPAGGSLVETRSDNLSALPVQSNYLIPEGQTGAAFSVTAGAVTDATLVTAGASYGGVSRTATLTVAPALGGVALSSIGISPATVVSGQAAIVTLTLNGPALAGGAAIGLTSSSPAFPVPSTYTVAEGQSSVSFSVTARSMTAVGSVTATVRAEFGGSSQTVMVAVSPVAARVVLSSVSISPAAVTSGHTAIVTVVLSGPAPPSGAPVSLASSSAAFSVPPSYLVAAGETSAIFVVIAGSVQDTEAVTLTAAYGGISKMSAASVLPAVHLDSIGGIGILQKQTVATGETAIISLTLIGVAPADGARVSVVSSEPTALPVEAVYVIPAGHSTTSFGVPAGLVSTAMTVTLTASYGGTSATASVIVTPPQTVPLSAVSVTPAVIPSGQTASMTLTLSAPAPAGGATVGTFSTSTVLLNAAYTIAPGQTSGDFVIQAGTVSAATQVVIYASYGGVTQTATVNVVPSNAPVTLSSYTIAPATAIAGDTVTLTFGLTGPAPAGGSLVETRSDNLSALPVQSNYLIPEGQTGAAFSVTAGAVTDATLVTAGASYGGVSRTATLTVAPALGGVALSSIGISPATVVSGQAAIVTLTLNGPALAGGAAIGLTSSSPAFPVPSTYTVAEGQSSVSFSVTARSMTAVGSVTATVRAEFGGSSQSATASVTPPLPSSGLTSISISPSEVQSGQTASITLTLNAPAGSDGVSVNLHSSSAAFSVPASFLIPEGQVSGMLDVPAGSVSAFTMATVSARARNIIQVAVVTVIPVVQAPVILSGIDIHPATIVSGESATLSLTLNGPAPSGGASVTVTSDDPVLFPVQAVYLIPAGQSKAGFTVQAGTTSSPMTTKVQATLGNTHDTMVMLVASDPSPSPAATLTAFSITPLTITSGNTAVLDLTLSRAAPAEGTLIALSSGDSTALPLQPAYFIPGGQSHASFEVRAGAVSTPRTVALGAAITGASRATLATVTPSMKDAVLTSISAPAEASTSGSAVTFVLTLSGPAPPDGARVTLSSSNLEAFPLEPSYLIPAGRSGAAFTVQTAAVEVPTEITLRASYQGATQSATAILLPPASPVMLRSIRMDPPAVLSGATAVLTLSLSRPSSEDAWVRVSSGDSTTLPLRPSYLISKGQSSVSFGVKVRTVSTSTVIPVAAAYGDSSQGITVTVEPLPSASTLQSITVSPATVASGATTLLILTLSGPAPAGGASVNLSGLESEPFPGPASYVIPAGQQSVAFTVQAGEVSGAASIPVSAAYGGSIHVALATVISSASELSLGSVTISPAKLTSGGTATLTLTLSGAAPPEGAPVSLAGMDLSIFPALSSYIVPAGVNTASFGVEVGNVTASTPVDLTAGFAGATRGSTLTVVPKRRTPQRVRSR